MPVPENCPGCGAETGGGENWRRAFVRYEADPNGAQEETGWVDDIPETLYAFVCSECGRVLGVIDEDSYEEERPSRGDGFRIDKELR